MAVLGFNTKILVDEFDFSGTTNGVLLSTDTSVIEYMVLQNNGVLKLPNLVSPAIEHRGYYNGPDAGDIEYELNARLGSANDVIVGVVVGTNLAAPVGYVLPSTFNQQLRIETPIENLISVNGNWPGGTSRIYRGLQAALGDTVDATGAVAGNVDFGAAGAAGGRAWIFVQDIGGTATDATIEVQSDSDSGFGTVANEGTFTFSDVGAYQISLSGTVGRYVRANLTSLGGADDITFLMIVALSGVSY